MATSRRKQNTDITRICGILFLEVLAAIVLFNLVGFAQLQRTELENPVTKDLPTMSSVESNIREPYPYPESLNFSAEKSLPKVAVGRYNVEGNF
jgi:hypothetical protein